MFEPLTKEQINALLDNVKQAYGWNEGQLAAAVGRNPITLSRWRDGKVGAAGAILPVLVVALLQRKPSPRYTVKNVLDNTTEV